MFPVVNKANKLYVEGFMLLFVQVQYQSVMYGGCTLSQLRLQKEVALVGRSTTCGLCSGIVGHTALHQNFTGFPRSPYPKHTFSSLPITIFVF